MALAQLVYISRRNKAVSLVHLQELVERSRKNNAARDITGILVCWGSNLMQLLEGELFEITQLFETIRLDPRHTDVRCLICKNTNKRLFPEWGMELNELTNPALVDRNRLVRMLQDLRDNIDTSHFAVEARILLADFKQQLEAA